MENIRFHVKSLLHLKSGYYKAIFVQAHGFNKYIFCFPLSDNYTRSNKNIRGYTTSV